MHGGEGREEEKKEVKGVERYPLLWYFQLLDTTADACGAIYLPLCGRYRIYCGSVKAWARQVTRAAQHRKTTVMCSKLTVKKEPMGRSGGGGIGGVGCWIFSEFALRA